MRNVIFPINNGKVSRGDTIKRELIAPLREHLGESFTITATSVTDLGLLEFGITNNVVSPKCRQNCAPELDYVERHEREVSFRLFMEEGRGS
jgi:hypothetical protein